MDHFFDIMIVRKSFDNYDYSGTESDIDMLICFELGSYGIDESSLYGGKGICDEYLSGFTLGLCGTV